MALDRKKLPRRSKSSNRAPRATCDAPDALAVVHAMPNSDLLLAWELLVDLSIRRVVRRTSKRENDGNLKRDGQSPDYCAAMAPSIVNCVPSWRTCLTLNRREGSSGKLKSCFEPEAATWIIRGIPRSPSTYGSKSVPVPKVTAAKETTADEFGLEVETVTKIWGRFKPLLEAAYGRACAPPGAV